MFVRSIVFLLALTFLSVADAESLLRLHATAADGPEESPSRIIYSKNHPVAYVLADNVLVYRFEPNSEVTLIGEYFNGIPDREATDDVDHDEWQIVLSPDERHLYTLNLMSQSITVWSISGNGEVLEKQGTSYSFQAGYIGLRRLLYAAFNPDGSKLYLTSEVGGIAIFDRNQSTGMLSEFRRYDVNDSGWENLAWIYDLAFSADGRWLYVTSYYPGALLVLSVAPDGSLTQAESFPLPSDTEFSAAAKLIHHPTLPVLYVLGVNEVRALSLNAETGSVSEISRHRTEAPAGYHYFIWDNLSVSADGSTLYLTEVDIFLQNQQLKTIRLSMVTGHFESIEVASLGHDPELSLAFSAAESADGQRLMLTLPAVDSIAFFERRNGLWFRMTQRSLLSSNGGPSLASVSYLQSLGDGRSFVYYSYAEAALAEIEVNALTGEPEFRGALKGAIDRLQQLKYPRAFTLSPDGRYVYLTSHFDDSQEPVKLAVIKRTAPGEFEPWLFYTNNDLGVPDQPSTAVGYASWLWVSEDGKHLYISTEHDGIISSASGDEVVMRFRRNPETGALMYEGYDLLLEPGKPFDGNSAMRSWSTVASKKGNLLYVNNNETLQVIRRDPETGSMSRLQWLRIGNNGYMTYSRDERSFYVVQGRKIRIFTRDLSTDLLSETGGWDVPDNYDPRLNISTLAVHPGGRTAFVVIEQFDLPRVMLQLARDDETGALTTVGPVEGYQQTFQPVSWLPMLHLGSGKWLAAIGSHDIGVDSSEAIQIYEYTKTQPVKPVAPSVVHEAGKVNVAWSPSNDAQQYNLYRVSTGAAEPQLLYRGSGHGYADSTVQVGVTYRYYMTQCNEMGCSPASEQSTVSIQAPADDDSGGGGGSSVSGLVGLLLASMIFRRAASRAKRT